MRPARAVAVVVGGQVVRDADQPGPQRPAVRLALRALEVPVGLEEGLLREVLGVVMVAEPVVRVAVDVAQMRAVELREVPVQTLLVRGPPPTIAEPTPSAAGPQAARLGASGRRAHALEPLVGGGRRRRARGAARWSPARRCPRARRRGRAAARSRATRPSGRCAASTAPAGSPAPTSSPARRLRLPSARAVATRSPAPASPAKVSLRPPLASASAWTSEKIRPAAAPARFGPARRGRRGRERGGVLGAGGQLGSRSRRRWPPR